MKLASGLAWAAALLGSATGVTAADSVVYQDYETGFTFSQYSAKYTLQQSMVFRTAIPSSAQQGQAYDIVIQIVAPRNVGWAGLAWGGSMTNNPLTVFWLNGQTGVVASRWATGHTTPSTYSGATYQVFKAGTHANNTHWQVTAKCTGCTSFSSSSGGRTTTLNPKGSNRLAFAYSSGRPSNPSSPTSSFPIHDVTNYWQQDFSSGSNPSFDSLVAKNG
ncbi:uncharacterized protein E0L32_006881 [Thyridium curvatum]|uniref:Cellobiose dehydrogenase-like cytochrome domain-containing protein n=1 Tax=Thyridium curvatum TaxID=1093900 RepID=A0A507B543_9PEZI|nr:uncharacterized protein E0L32_006881 [Thyridium curvatum]TPX12469.1 hypothetical protein E0L32_006881 [Thyridium curvatum]